MSPIRSNLQQVDSTQMQSIHVIKLSLQVPHHICPNYTKKIITHKQLQRIPKPILCALQPQLAPLRLLIIPQKLDTKQHDHNNHKRIGANGDIQPILVVWRVFCPEDGRADDAADSTGADDCGGGEGAFL